MFACLTYQLLSVFFSLFTLLNLNQFNFKQFYLPDMPVHVQSYNQYNGLKNIESKRCTVNKIGISSK